MTEFASLVQGRLSVAEYVRQFDRLAKFAPDVVPSDRSRRDKFLRGLNSMIHRDVVITLNEDLTTYAQTVDKALTAERVENQIWRESAVRREQRRPAPPQFGPGRGSSDQQKRKAPDRVFHLVLVLGDEVLQEVVRVVQNLGDHILCVKDVTDVTMASVGLVRVLLVEALIISGRTVHNCRRRMQ